MFDTPIINIEVNTSEVINDLVDIFIVMIPQSIEVSAIEAGMILENSIKQNMPGMRLASGQRFKSSGRLMASFGHANPTLTNSSEFNSDDAIFNVKRTLNGVEVVLGTKVPYAVPVNDGFIMDEQRIVYLGMGKNDRPNFITVSPFYFSGYHFVEKGLAEARAKIMSLFEKGLQAALLRKKLKTLAQPRTLEGTFTSKQAIASALRSFKVARQPRSNLGKFVKIR